MTQSAPYCPRRTAKADPRLGQHSLFSEEINQRLAEEVPPEARQSYFTRAMMPAHWLEAMLENQPSYRERDTSLTMNFRNLPASMVTEFVWTLERQVRLGMRIQAQNTSRLAQHVALVLADSRHAQVVSLLDLSRDQWIRAMRKVGARRNKPRSLETIGCLLGRVLDLLVHVYHQGHWWELNVWNPVLDTRIPLREHEPQRHNLSYFSHLTTPWLREAAKWWLSRQLEREVYSWTTVHTRQQNLTWFQRYLDLHDCDGPHLLNDQRQLGNWVTGCKATGSGCSGRSASADRPKASLLGRVNAGAR
ncbi:hypothetical protein ACQPZF_36030 [Actinosynnema sp. CS-041913]|uniref:hypothetical protein n=1 Tax=Actinosynnema sp. CS-041913 TaxID=3239917 RepID=UPI003D94D4C2